MNDFTKEELNTIIWHLNTKTVIKLGDPLVPKIQNMIENYCNHQWQPRTGKWDAMKYHKQCSECGVKDE